MNKLEFTDLYRFLVSLGMVLIAFAVLVPWLFLHETFDLNLKATEISELTDTAQTLIVLRQNIALWFLQNMVWISVSLTAMGLILSLTGSVFWMKKQHNVDSIDDLSLQKTKYDVEKSRRELEPLNPMQIAQKGIDKSDRDMLGKSDIEGYFRVETLFLDKLIACYGQDRILTQQKIRQATYDAVLIGNQQKADVIFDIRTLMQIDSHRIEQIIRQAIKQASIYTEATGHCVISIPVLIVGQNIVLEDIKRNFEKFMPTALPAYIKISPLYIQEDRLSQLSDNELRVEVDSRASL